jgi:hypothetical protein
MITFKTFLEEREQPKFLSQEEFDALPEVSPDNIGERFRVQKVAFDNVNGMGATPNNQEVAYFGFAMELKPSQFLRVVTYQDRAEDAARFAKFIENRAALGSPMLYLKVNLEEWQEGKPLRAEVTNHEGRGRMWAIDAVNGNTPTPVHVILRGGLRAKDLNKKFFEDLREAGLVREKGSEFASPTLLSIGRIFWNGQTL